MGQSGYHYSFLKVRGVMLMPGYTIRLQGRAPEGVVFAYTNEDTSTYTAVDNHGVHVDSNDTKSGSCVINLQGTSPTDTEIEQVALAQETTGGDIKGSVTLSDIGGTGSVAMCTNAKLSSRPGITYAGDQPLRAWKLTGNVRIIKTYIPPIAFGVANVVPPAL